MNKSTADLLASIRATEWIPAEHFQDRDLRALIELAADGEIEFCRAPSPSYPDTAIVVVRAKG